MNELHITANYFANPAAVLPYFIAAKVIYLAIIFTFKPGGPRV